MAGASGLEARRRNVELDKPGAAREAVQTAMRKVRCRPGQKTTGTASSRRATCAREESRCPGQGSVPVVGAAGTTPGAAVLGKQMEVRPANTSAKPRGMRS